jgi:lambda family phage minor tail protein L
MTNIALPSINNLVEFVSIDLTFKGSSVFFFCNTEPPGGGITVNWDGQEWVSTAFQSSGWQLGGDSTNGNNPSIIIPDFSGEIYTTVRQLNGIGGALINRYQALGADVTSGNTTGIFSHEIMFVKQTSQSAMSVKLDLGTHFDFAQTQIPAFIMTQQQYPGLQYAALPTSNGS